MALTVSESHISKKSRRKKSHSAESINVPKKTVFSNSQSGTVPEEPDESETDLDKPVFKLPHHSGTMSNSQNANGDISDSETDVDKPPKKTVVHKSVSETRTVKSSYNTQSAVQQSDTDEESDDSDEEQQSMSLLQMQPANITSMKKSNQVRSSSKSNNSSLPTSGALKSQVTRKPNVPEMSPSESEEATKKLNHPHSQSHLPQPQQESESEEESSENEPPPKTSQINNWSRTEPQPESESEEEEEEEQSEGNHNLYQHYQQLQQQQQQQQTTAPNLSVRIKEEVNQDSSFEEDDPAPFQEFENTPMLPSVESRSVSLQGNTPQNSSGVVMNTSCLSDAAAFEQEHTRISAPVVDIPQNSRVWVLQVPRSIQPVHLHGQYLPKKLKGGEVLNLPSGRWQILEQPYEASRSTLSCIVSTGNFCYGVRWLQPRGFWFLKKSRTPLQMETADVPWKQEITPVPIKELLKMKSSRAISKDQHLSPSKKRHRVSDINLPSKRLKIAIPEEISSNMDESMPKKKKHHHVGLVSEEQPSIQGGETGKEKKRKHASEANEESPKMKKKKKKNIASEVDDQPHSEGTESQLQSVSVADAIRNMYSGAAGNVSHSKKEKKGKHKESSDNAEKSCSCSPTITKIKQENTADESSWVESSSMHNASENSRNKKQKKHMIHIKQEVEDEYEMNQNESRETAEIEKKKKRKHRRDESVHEEETFQMYEKKKNEKQSSPSSSISERTEKTKKKEKKKHSQQNETSLEDADSDVRKKKKHKHHHNNAMEGEVSVQNTEEEIPVKKKGKHKHKRSDVPKVKQENFWERETSPDFLSHLYLTQAAPEDK